jgi:hypothetical protein
MRIPGLLATMLLLGSLLLLGGVALHPVLPLTASGDLSLIQATRHWRAIHLVLLYATGMIIAGVWGRWLVAEGEERPGLAVGFAVLGLGQALNAVNIAYMTGAGTLLAQMANAGEEVTGIYQATHMFAVSCGRVAGFLVAVAAGVIALATRQRKNEPGWLVWIAATACGVGLLGNLFAPPGHPLMLAAIGVMAVWQVATGGRMLFGGSTA